MEVCEETSKVQYDPFIVTVYYEVCAKAPYVGKPKLCSGTGLIIAKGNIELSKKEIKKLPRNFLINIIALMVT